MTNLTASDLAKVTKKNSDKVTLGGQVMAKMVYKCQEDDINGTVMICGVNDKPVGSITYNDQSGTKTLDINLTPHLSPGADYKLTVAAAVTDLMSWHTDAEFTLTQDGQVIIQRVYKGDGKWQVHVEEWTLRYLP
ncbi:MAG: hypothetical protein QM768_02325 [Agriterribacter sp.]